MKKIIFSTIVLLLFAVNTQGADSKIGYIDLTKALNESDNGKKAMEILENMVDSKQAVVLKKQGEINKLKEELEKQASVLTPASRKDKEDHINKLIRDVQRMINDFQEEIQKKEAELRREILKELEEIINKLGEEDGYSIIFEKGISIFEDEKGTSNILYSPEKFDITEKVITRYNEITKAKK